MSLRRVLEPASVAVIGASNVPTKRGYQAIRTLQEDGFAGPIHPINPKETEILGLPCARSIADVDGDVDLALITTPARTVPGLLEQCADRGVGGAVIIAGGFAEMGADGAALQAEIHAIARRRGIRLIGPNTSGMINVGRALNLVGIRDVPRGPIALVSQSGNMALALITEARERTRVGFSHYVGVGNEADIRWHEYVEHFRDDPAVRAILMYVEGMRDGRAFLEVARATTPVKPIVLLKSGRSDVGRSAAGSHSGALAGRAEVARSAFRRAGVVVVEDSDELLAVAETLASLPAMASRRVAILADGGGHATLAADALTKLGIEIPPVGADTQAALRALLPPAATVANPVDVAGGTDADPARFADCARILLADPAVDGLLLIGLFGGYGIRFAAELAAGEQRAADGMAALVEATGKPIVVHSLYKYARPDALERLREGGIPVQDSLEVACRCVAALAEAGAAQANPQAASRLALRPGDGAIPEGQALIAAARADGRDALLEHEARQLLALHGVPVAPSALVTSADEAAAAARRFDASLAMKVVSPQILHKSDVGGVALGVDGEAAARAAFVRLQAAAAAVDGAELRGVLAAPMAAPGLELIVGAEHDDQFGPVVLCGLGGVLVEVMADVAFRVVPLDGDAAASMLDELRGARLLDGYRGRPPADRAAIAALLRAVSAVVEAYPAIRSLDLNPVIAREHGLDVVDARILLEPAG